MYYLESLSKTLDISTYLSNAGHIYVSMHGAMRQIGNTANTIPHLKDALLCLQSPQQTDTTSSYSLKNLNPFLSLI